METKILILPGFGNSGAKHWQSQWERTGPNFIRVQQRDWNKPDCAEWVRTLDRAIGELANPPVLVAHSLACLVVVRWAVHPTKRIKGALLVAPPDPEGPNFPPMAIGFASIPQVRLDFPSIVIASSNDPYGSLEYARRCAVSWGSRFINIGDCGHINDDSGLGNWPEGMAQLESIIKQNQSVCV